MTNDDFAFIAELIREEIRRQDKKWGANRTLDQRTWVTVLTEEVGEIARATLEGDTVQYLAETIQVAAVAMQMIWGDLDFNKDVPPPEEVER